MPLSTFPLLPELGVLISSSLVARGAPGSTGADPTLTSCVNSDPPLPVFLWFCFLSCGMGLAALSLQG